MLNFICSSSAMEAVHAYGQLDLDKHSDAGHLLPLQLNGITIINPHHWYRSPFIQILWLQSWAEVGYLGMTHLKAFPHLQSTNQECDGTLPTCLDESRAVTLKKLNTSRIKLIGSPSTTINIIPSSSMRMNSQSYNLLFCSTCTFYICISLFP